MWICSNCGRENKDYYLNCMDCAHIETDHIRNREEHKNLKEDTLKIPPATHLSIRQ